MISQTLNQIQARWSTFWNRLTEPNAALEEPLEREQARLLSSTLWVFLLTTCALFVGRLGSHGLHGDFDLSARIAIIVFSFVASILSHRGHVRLISLISALFGSLIIFYVVLFGGYSAGLSTLNYLIVVIIFGSLFLPFWLNALIFAIQLAGILACAWLLSNIAFAEFLSGPLSFHLTLGVIALSITHYRNSLESTRKTAITLSEKRFRGIFETSPIGIKLYDASGEFQGANPTCLNNFGFLQSSSAFHLNLFVDPLVSAEAKERLCNGEMLRFENKFTPKKAQLRPGSPVAEEIRYQDVSITPLLENGAVQGYLMQLVDVSEQKRVEEIVRARRNNLLLISDNLPAMIAHIDADQRYIFTNQPYAEFFKWSPKTIIGCRVQDVIGAELHGNLSAYVERVLAGERVEFETSLNDASSCQRIVQAVFVPDADPSGRVNDYFAMILDITERKRAEEILRANEARLAHKAAQLELLNRTSEQLAAVTSISDVLNRAVQIVRQSFNYHRVSIFLGDESFKDWVLMAKAGDFPDSFPAEFRIQSETGIVGWVASHGKTRLANDVNSDPIYVNPYPDVIPTLAELCVPISIDAHVIGALNVQSPELDAFDESDVLVMETMAKQIGISIENARLHTFAQQELAERKRAEAFLQTALQEKETLVREVHHRVKNNLQVIASLLNLRAETLADPRAIQAFQDCQNSISAIASVHKSLYESSNLSSIKADEYLSNLIYRLQTSFQEKTSKINLNLSIEPVDFDFDTAIPCGLILNELLTNAYKYAFPTARGDQDQLNLISVTLYEKGAQVFLSIRDNGIGFPNDFEHRKNQALGLQLASLLAKQIKGSMTMDGSAGTVIEIVFPSPRMKDRGQDAGSPNPGG